MYPGCGREAPQDTTCHLCTTRRFHLQCARRHHPPGTPNALLFCYHCSLWLQNRCQHEDPIENPPPLEEDDEGAGPQADENVATPGVVVGTNP